jgi:hypothetical protein
MTTGSEASVSEIFALEPDSRSFVVLSEGGGGKSRKGGHGNN